MSFRSLIDEQEKARHHQRHRQTRRHDHHHRVPCAEQTRPGQPAALARILEVARELDYVPNAFARGLKRSESLIIGVITASVDNPFYSEMIKAISREAKQHGYTIMLVDTDELEELESKAVDTLLGYRVAGSSCRRSPTSRATNPTTWNAWATARRRWCCSTARCMTARSAA